MEKCGEEPSQWASKAFPMIKGNGKDVRIVSDFKTLNKAIERPHWPTESSDQLLRNIESDSKYFVTLDLTSGYHQFKVDVESRNLLCISTPSGRYRYTTLAQGVCSAGDLFNFTTDGDVRVNGMRVVKNMDDLLFYHSTLEGVMKELEKFLVFCKEKNLKLKPSKFCVGEEVEFGGALITSETVGSKNVVNILPKSQRVKAFQNLKRPQTKKEVQVFCGMLTSLRKWAPNAPLNAPALYAATGGNKGIVFEWTDAMEEEYKFLKEEMKKCLKLSPYNPDQKLRLIIDGSRTVGTGFILV